MAKYKCKLCGYIYEGELNEYYECPLCHAKASKFEKIEEEKKEENEVLDADDNLFDLIDSMYQEE